MTTHKDLVLIDKARTALAEAKTIAETLEIRDQAQAMATYAKRKKGAEEAARYANEIRLRAERKIGELTRALARAPKGLSGRGSRRELSTKAEALSGAGLSKKDAHECEAIAAIPDVNFEEEVVKPEASKARLVRIGRKYQPKPKKRKPEITTDPRADWLFRVAEEAWAEARRSPDRFSQAIRQLGKQAKVLGRAIRADHARK